MSFTIHPDRQSLSIEEFCRAVGIGRTAAFAELRSGRLRARKCGRRTLVPVEAVKTWLAALPERSASDVL